MSRAVFIVFALMIGCGGASAPPAPPVASTVTTRAAEESAPAASATASATAAEAAPADASDPPPKGRLVCKTTDAVDGTNELFLEWEGQEATGVLRNTTQSGMRHEQRVKAERDSTLIIVDDPHESDLVTHAAVLQRQGSTLTMRLGKGMSGTWVTCQ